MNSEVSCRAKVGWEAFALISSVLKAQLDKILHASLSNNTIIPAVLYER